MPLIGLFALACVFLCGCGTVCDLPTPLPLKSLSVAVFDNLAHVRVFSDKDEVEDSTSVCAISLVGFDDTSLRLEYDIETYGGFAVSFEPINALPYDTLSLRVRKLSGQMPPAELQLTSADGARKKVGISSLLAGVGESWKKVDVDLLRMTRFDPTALERITEAAVILLKGKGVLEFDDLVLRTRNPGRRATLSKPPYPRKSTRSLPPGLGAWCYGDPKDVAKTVRRMNTRPNATRKIRYLFPYAGSMSFGGERGFRIDWTPAAARKIAKAVGEDVLVLPMIDGISSGSDVMSDEKWADAGRECAELLAAAPEFYGLHFDIEPHIDELNLLFAAVMNNTDKPVTIAAGRWNTDTFRYTDMVVLMGYDWATDPRRFSSIAEQRIRRLIDCAKEAGGKAMVGVPAIATHQEYESFSTAPSGSRTPTGHSMLDYLRESISATTPLISRNDPNFIGFSIWAIHPEGGLHGKSDTKWFFPSRISPGVEEALLNP